MKLVIYNTENSRTDENRIGRRSIRFNSVNGNMYLSLQLSKDLNIKPGDRLEFARDEDNPKEWFLHKTTDKLGFPLQSNGGGLRLHNKFICQTILDAVKIKGSAVFFVSKDPVQAEQGAFYKVLLSCPVYSNCTPKRKPAAK